ncbi:hypothetical protein GF340_04185 [Candidatus Peregrinibacteria bacterium]|nr:hypothetical protein [Candidatus Peregrinibacteria bacterium]
MNIFQEFTQNRAKFQRRKDLTLEVRLWIAFVALMSNKWGTITQLAAKFVISRTFVYMLQAQLSEAAESCFGLHGVHSKTQLMEAQKTKSLECALMLRLEGKCSIPSISDILKRMGLPNNSVGTISQELNKIGCYLPNTFYAGNGEILYVYLAVDELFSHSRPILISVDPISSAILRIELSESRKTEDWINHFDKLREEGAQVILVVSDEGQGICSAKDMAIPDAPRQPDTFHAISHRLGKWVNSLEKSAYAAIDEEYKREAVFWSAKTEDVMQKRLESYLQAKSEAEQAIILYQDYKFLYHCIIDNLQVFDGQGNPYNRIDAEENIRVALDYMISLPIKKIKKDINTIYNLLDDLLGYLDTADQIFKNLRFKGMPEYMVKAFALAWQYQKNAAKAKQPKRRKYFADKEKEQLQTIGQILGDDFESIKTKVFNELDKIIQSSAIVENINSIVRSFLNTSRNRINQEILNLIMFYHNHRRYKAGKRKGKTPMELLTGKKQDKDWLEMLLELTKKNSSIPLVA